MHLTTLVALVGVLLAAAVPTQAQDRARTKEVIVAFAAEPRTLLPNTIVDWTTNNSSSTCTTGWWTGTPRATSPSPCSPRGGRS